MRNLTLSACLFSCLLVNVLGCGDDSTTSKPKLDAGNLPDSSVAMHDASVSDAAQKLDANVGAEDATVSDTDANVSEDDGGTSIADSCIASGGTVGSGLCCANGSDFPNTCTVGACSCAPQHSHTVRTCHCPVGKCFDGAKCK